MWPLEEVNEALEKDKLVNDISQDFISICPECNGRKIKIYDLDDDAPITRTCTYCNGEGYIIVSKIIKHFTIKKSKDK